MSEHEDIRIDARDVRLTCLRCGVGVMADFNWAKLELIKDATTHVCSPLPVSGLREAPPLTDEPKPGVWRADESVARWLETAVEPDAGKRIPLQAALADYHRESGDETMSPAAFARHVLAAAPSVRSERRRGDDGMRERYLIGLRWRIPAGAIGI